MEKRPKIIMTIFSTLIGLAIAFQIKGKIGTYVPATLESINQYKTEIENIKTEITEINGSIKSKEEELEILKKVIEEDSEENIINFLEDDILQNRMKSGTISLEGPGIIIKMYDNPEERSLGYDINEDVIHDIDLFRIVNDLRVAGAEAISINSERVMSISEIKCGGPIVRINNRSSGTPFILKAIGDSKKLMAAVNAPGTYGYVLKNIHEKGFDTEVEDSIIIPGHERPYNFRYAKPIGEEK